MTRIFALLILAGCSSAPLTPAQRAEHPFCDGSRHSDYQWVCEDRGAKRTCTCTPVYALPRDVRREFDELP